MGTGTFSQTPFTLQLSRNYYLAAVADMNGDTLPDIVLSDGYIVSILYNQGGLSSPPNRSFGNETHFLAGQGINSLTLESVRGSTVPDLVVANGGATISNPIVLGGAAQTSATLPVNPDVNTGGITVLLNNITALQTTGTLTSSPPTSTIGEAFTITATLTPSSGQHAHGHGDVLPRQTQSLAAPCRTPVPVRNDLHRAMPHPDRQQLCGRHIHADRGL